MKPININEVQIKNLLGLYDTPTLEDLLYEIVNFLHTEKRYDGIFTVREASLKTTIRINEDFHDDIKELEKLGYIQFERNTKYQLIKHSWEI